MMNFLFLKTASPGMEDATFKTTFKSLYIPLIGCLFSGYLNMEALMFVWDQYVIGSDVGGFNDELVPLIAAIILILMREQLMSVATLVELEERLKTQAKFILSRQLKALISKHFFKQLQSKINVSKFGPVIDPTAGRLLPWEHWHQEVVPRRVTRNNNE
jgi:hypothetical protein